MSKTQYNPNFEIDRRLIAAGASKTIYALVMPETERVLLETIAPPLRVGARHLDEASWLIGRPLPQGEDVAQSSGRS